MLFILLMINFVLNQNSMTIEYNKKRVLKKIRKS